MTKLPAKTFERDLIAQGYDYIIGIDEVGMGCLAGPVTACAVMIDKNFYKHRYSVLSGLRDSKLLSAPLREKYSKELARNKYIRYAVASVDVKTIDAINIYQASRKAMLECLEQLRSEGDEMPKPAGVVLENAVSSNSFLLIDGNKLLKGIELNQKAIVKGDRKLFSIACASIIAKVTRDQLMTDYDREFPGYEFSRHKGYATALHREKIAQLGLCILHRLSFRIK